MAICQIMIRDFMYGGHPEGYGEYDLKIGLDYAEALIAAGETLEPFHHYNLARFKTWAKRRLDSMAPVTGEKAERGGAGVKEVEFYAAEFDDSSLRRVTIAKGFKEPAP